MKKKLVAAVLCGTMALSLTACGSSASTKEESTSAEETASSTAEETEAADTTASSTAAAEASGDVTTINDGVLTMGTNAAFPPYEYYDGDDIVGIDAEIAAGMAEKLGLELDIIDMDFSSIITSVQSGKIDIGLAGMTVTDERKENVNFTDSYANSVQVIIVPEDSKIATVDDLDGALIGVQEGTTGHLYCSDDYGEENVVAYTNGATAVQALTQGKVDCVVIDQQPAKAYVEANDGLKILDTEYVTEEYAAAVSKDNEALLNALNEALTEMKDDGTLQEIIDKYITAD